MTLVITEPLRIHFWIPGSPKAKARSRSAVSKNGKPFMRDDPRNPLREAYVRECFTAALDRHPEVAPYLPVPPKGAILLGAVYALFPPPDWWFSEYWAYLNKPDRDNLDKLVWDALSGKGSGRPALLCTDDQILAGGGGVWKVYWNPQAAATIPGYPKEPGTCVDIRLLPIPRDPRLAPPGTLVCPGCSRDDFKDARGLAQHTRRCGAAVDPTEPVC